MSLRRCIPELEQNGQLNRDQADRLGNLFDELEKDYSTKFGAQVAEQMASKEAVDRFAAEAAHKRRQAALQVTAQQRITLDVRKFRGDNPGAAAAALFTHDSRAPYSNVERRADIIEGQAHALMNGILEKFSRNMRGQVRERALLHNVVREAFGEHTGDHSAADLAKSWGDAAELMRNRFNAAGGAIGKLENWGMPQIHNMLAVRSVPFEEWRGTILPMLDREKMLDESGHPLTPQQLETSLRSVYDTVSTDGWNKRDAGGMVGSGKLANRHGDSRFLIFKDADSWMEYSKKFGRPLSSMAEKIDPDGPIYDAMMTHIRSMASEIAQMEILGPNPAATVRWIKDGLDIEARLPKHSGMDRIKDADRGKLVVDHLFDELSGRNRGIDNNLKKWFGMARSWQSAAKLGGAMLSAVTDVGFQHTTRRFNGIPAANALAGYVRLLKPGSHADHALSTRLWMVAEEATRQMASQSRWTGEVMTGEMAARLSEGVQRVSGLSAWTQAGRWAFGQEFWSHITDQSSKNWANINAPFRKQLEKYGFSEGDWDHIRSTPHEDVNGSKWILPENIGRKDVAERLSEMIATEMDYAVPQASIRVMAGINSSLKRGTWLGEITRSLLLFKAFPITVMMMHGRRAFEQQGVDKLSYAASLIVSTTIMGALAYQLKGFAAGKDIADMDPSSNPSFWAKAMAQGGGFGIAGDFINSTTSRTQNDVYSTMAGPMASTLVDAINVVKNKNHTRNLQRFLWSNTPGSSIWYTRLALQREVMDQLQMMHDPNFYDSFSKMRERARQDATDFWWKPGDTAPARAPTTHQGEGART